MRRLLGSLVVLTLVVSACGGGSGGLQVSDVRLGQPTGPNAALYLTAVSDEDDSLIGAETDVAAAVELHETTMGDDGTMGMHPVDGFDVGGGEDLVLEPGGLHLMLVDVDRLEVGETVEVTLVWAEAGEMTVSAEVVAPEDAMEHGG